MTSNLGAIASAVSSIATQGPEAAAYAASHGVRTGYFVVNAVLGSLGSELHEFVRGREAGAKARMGDGAASSSSVLSVITGSRPSSWR